MLLRRTLLRPLGLGALALASLGCERLVDVKLTLVEPCDQRDQALNGVQTFQVSVSGFEEEATTRFTRDKGAQPLQARGAAEDAVVTVEAWEGDADSILTTPPKSIGRTMPLQIADDTRDMEINLTMGRVDGFGQTTAADGSCQALQNGAGVPGRHGHTATFVPGLNKILIAGGAVFSLDPQSGQPGESLLKSAELFDPATGTFEKLADMPNTRAYHTATALPDGRVLLVGGFSIIGNALSTLTNGLIFDPSRPLDDPYDPVPVQFSQQRALHTATLIDDELLVIVGGCDGAGCRSSGVSNPGGPAGGDPTALLYPIEVLDLSDIAAGGAPQLSDLLVEKRAMHAASTFEGGRMLISGGVNASGPVCSLEIFEARDGALVALQEPGVAALPACPSRHTQVTIGRDRIAFIGGQTEAPGGTPQGEGSDQVVFWNTAVGVEAVGSTLLSGRYNHASALLKDGSILVIGGKVPPGGATAERLKLDENNVYTSATLQGPPLRGARERAAIAPIPQSNQVFVSGGFVDVPALTTTESAEIYYGE